METDPLLPSFHHGSQNLRSRRKLADKIIQKDDELAEKLLSTQSPKLDTYSGVFLPTALNVLSILMFLRFGFIVGQLGILGLLFTLVLCYAINLLTTLLVLAIATNGVVRTGGAYYMISRSLGPEFGGAVGLIFYFGQVLNSALNVVGLIEPLTTNFGESDGSMATLLPEGYEWTVIYATVILAACVGVSLIGSEMVSRAAVLLFMLLMTSVVLIPVLALFKAPFEGYTGLSWSTFMENLFPRFTKHAAGSQIDGVETFSDLFGIFFPATAGILAGASMSGLLANPLRSIPLGTLWGLLLTFCCYALVIVSLGASVPRETLYSDILVIQSVSLAQVVIVLGEFSTLLFSIIMGVVGAAEILVAISADSIIPGVAIFRKQNIAIVATWLLTQLFLFANINQIATLITMAFLMTFVVINVACVLLEISAAPNFRPSFEYFSRATALLGAFACVLAMFIVDGLSAGMIVLCLLLLIFFIHYVCPPKSWGDVSQTLIYHQVRKYLFKLRQDNVKYWRPQILLLVDNPRTCWTLMHFCNSLKKGGLYILGHVIVSGDEFEAHYEEYAQEKNSWVLLRDRLKLKAFVQFSYAQSLPWGVRNIFLGSGLGSMKPNIIVIGFIDLSNRKVISSSGISDNLSENSLIPKSIEKFNYAFANQGRVSSMNLPTDGKKEDQRIRITEWVQCIEELLLMKANVAVAKGFPRLDIPDRDAPELSEDQKAVIDLYPIQMAAEIAEKSGKTLLSTNFDTYTLILQLGAILTTVPQWQRTHRLRIVVFVESPEDVAEEKERVAQLISVLRINAEILALSFNSGNYSFYDCIVKNKCADKRVLKKVNRVLQNNEWWRVVSELRAEKKTSRQDDIFNSSFVQPVNLSENIGKKNITFSKLQRLGVNLRMRTNKLLNLHVMEQSSVFDDQSSDSESMSSINGEGAYDSDPEVSIRKGSLKKMPNLTLASERRKQRRRKTFSSLISPVGSKPRLHEKLPKSPFLEPNGLTLNIPGLNLDEDEVEPKRPALSRQSSRHSYTSIRSQVRPNFSAQAMPKSKVNEEASGNEPTIMFLDDDNGSVRSRTSSLKNKRDKSVDREDKGKERDETSDVEAFFPEELVKQGNSLARLSEEPSDGEQSDDETSSKSSFDINDLTFNDVPARAQHLILNQLMMKCLKNSSIIFSTLPTPAPGCYKSKKDAIEYVETLDLWCAGLPPILLINSRTMTVTTAL